MNAPQPTAEITPPARVPPLWRFSLSELLGLITVAALAFACGGVHIGFGILASLIVFPAYIRTMTSCRDKMIHGAALGWYLKVIEFVGSCLYVSMALYDYLIALALVFLAAFLCLRSFFVIATSLHSWLAVSGIGLAAIVCLYIPYAFLRQVWKHESH